MKIAIITHHFPPGFNAGAEQYAYRVAKMLVKIGHQVEVVCIESITEGTLIPACKTGIFEDILVHRLYFNLALSPNPLELKFRNPALGFWVKEYLQRATPDIVHFNSGYLIGGTVIEAAFEIGIPSVLTLHEYWFLCPVHTLIRPDGKLCDTSCPPARCTWCYLSMQRRYRMPDRLLSGKLGDIFVRLYQSDRLGRWIGIQPVMETIEERRRYLKSVFGKVDIIISPSKFLIQKYYDFGLKEKKIVYLPFGLDTTHLIPQPIRSPSEVIQIGYLGQFANHKGVHILIDAFNRLDQSGRKCKLTLYGNLTNRTAYGKRILKSIRGRENIICAGRYDNVQVGDILSGLDLIVVPSIWFENRPTIIVEALAMKTPVVASKIGGIVELIEHEKNGLLCEPGDVAELASQLQRFLDDSALQSRLREGIQPVIRTEEEMEELLSLYSSLLPEKEV